MVMLPNSEFLSHQVGVGRHGCLLHACAFQGAEPLVVRGSRARAAPVLCLALGRGRGEVTKQLCTLCVPRGRSRGLWAGSCMREWRAAWTAAGTLPLFLLELLSRVRFSGLDLSLPSLPRRHGSDSETHKTHDRNDVGPKK